MAAKVRVTLTKSTVSTTRQARGTVRALGLHRIGDSVEVDDTPVTRGQIRAVQYLVRTEPAGTERTAAEHPSTHAKSGDEAPQENQA
jgi:large subunit ribosomal protein L30